MSNNVNMYLFKIDLKKIGLAEFLAQVVLRSEGVTLVNWWYII